MCHLEQQKNIWDDGLYVESSLKMSEKSFIRMIAD